MQQRPSTRLDFKESFDLQSTTSNANKKFDLRDGKVEVWLFVASAIFGAVFSLMIFQLLRLLRVHCLTFKPASCCHGEPQKAIDKVILAQFYSYFNYYFIIILTFWSFFQTNFLLIFCSYSTHLCSFHSTHLFLGHSWRSQISGQDQKGCGDEYSFDTLRWWQLRPGSSKRHGAD